MSLKIVILGISFMFISFLLAALVIINLIPPQIYIYSSIAVEFFAGLIIALIAILTNGILGPFITAKTRGFNIVAAITASKNIRLLTGNERSGMTETKDGYFLTPPDSVYTWPNGAKGGFAFYKYGTTLHPKFVKAASILKENDIKDIEQLEKVNEKMSDKELIIKVD